MVSRARAQLDGRRGRGRRRDSISTPSAEKGRASNAGGGHRARLTDHDGGTNNASCGETRTRQQDNHVQLVR